MVNVPCFLSFLAFSFEFSDSIWNIHRSHKFSKGPLRGEALKGGRDRIQGYKGLIIEQEELNWYGRSADRRREYQEGQLILKAF